MGVRADWGGGTSQVLGLPQGAGRPAGRGPGNATGLNLGRLRFAPNLSHADHADHGSVQLPPRGRVRGSCSPRGRPSPRPLGTWAETGHGRCPAAGPWPSPQGSLGARVSVRGGAEKHPQAPRAPQGEEPPCPGPQAAGDPHSLPNAEARRRRSLTSAAPPLSGSKGLDPPPGGQRVPFPAGPRGETPGARGRPGRRLRGVADLDDSGSRSFPTLLPAPGRGRGEPGAQREAGPPPAVPTALRVSARPPRPEPLRPPPAPRNFPPSRPLSPPRSRSPGPGSGRLCPAPQPPSLMAPRPEGSHDWDNCYCWAGR